MEETQKWVQALVARGAAAPKLIDLAEKVIAECRAEFGSAMAKSVVEVELAVRDPGRRHLGVRPSPSFSSVLPPFVGTPSMSTIGLYGSKLNLTHSHAATPTRSVDCSARQFLPWSTQTRGKA
jgi:hypothetical protein